VEEGVLEESWREGLHQAKEGTESDDEEEEAMVWEQPSIAP
jgi:hypothetical protein